MSIRKTTAIIGAAALAFATAPAASASTALGGSPSAVPASDALSDADVRHLTGFLGEYGVDRATQQDLISKLGRGELWDSLSTDEEPVHVEEREEDGAAVTVRTFQDGSIRASSVEQPRAASGDDFGVAAIDSCIETSNAQNFRIINGCRVYQSVGVVDAEFIVNYEVTPGPLVSSTITGVSERPQVLVVPGSADNLSTSIPKRQSDNAGPARARADADVTLSVAGGSGFYSIWLEFYAHHDGGRSDDSNFGVLPE